MEIFQQIWHALTTPNKLLIDILFIPISFVEITLTMFLLTTILNITSSKKQKILYISILTTISVFSNIFIPKQYGVFINIIIYPLIIIIIFRTSILKGLSAQILLFIIAALLETFIIKIYSSVFKISCEDILIVPFYRIISVGSIHFIYLILFLLSKNCNLSIKLIDDIYDKKNKNILILNLVLASLSIATQFILAGFYSDNLPIFITLLSIISLLSYFFISVYSFAKTNKLEIISKNLEETKLYNKTLSILHDNIRGFKHDFSNIVQAIGRLH